MLPGLTRAGFDVITTATNHARDCGLVRGCAYESLLETRTNLLGAGIQPVGTGVDLAGALAPVVLNVKGLRIAFLGLSGIAFLGLSGIDASLWAGPDTPGTAPLDQKAYTSAVQAAAAEADVVVALPHWGQEYKNELSWLQITHAEALAAAGADLIVGNHPHRAQAVETLPSGAVVAYALGNFVFDQQWSDGSQFTVQGIVLKVVLRGPEIVEVSFARARDRRGHADPDPYLRQLSTEVGVSRVGGHDRGRDGRVAPLTSGAALTAARRLS